METYDDKNKRISDNFSSGAPASGIQSSTGIQSTTGLKSVAGSIGNQGANSAAGAFTSGPIAGSSASFGAGVGKQALGGRPSDPFYSFDRPATVPDGMPGARQVFAPTATGPYAEPKAPESAASDTLPPPFKLYDASVGGAFKVGFRRGGKVNGVIPTIGGVPLWSETDPAYVQPTITITETTRFYFKIVETLPTSASPAVTIEAYTDTIPEDVITATGYTAYLNFGQATVSSGELSLETPVTGTRFVKSVGNLNLWW